MTSKTNFEENSLLFLISPLDVTVTSFREISVAKSTINIPSHTYD